jgi:hypothetical protein
MKKITLMACVGLLLIASPVLSGCAAADTVETAVAVATQPISQVSPSAAALMNDAKKALTSAHDAHAAAADFLTTIAKNGTLHGSTAATAKAWLDQSEAVLNAADKLVAVGDANGIMAKVSQAEGLIAQVQGIISR